MMNKKFAIIASGLVVALTANAQKKNETDAAMEAQKMELALFSGKMPEAGKAAIKAKNYIDAAAAHPDTKESPKTLYYKGFIYLTGSFISAADSTNAELKAMFPESSGEEAIATWKKVYSASDKFDSDIEEKVDFYIGKIATPLDQAYKAGKFAEAAAMYEGVAEMNSIFGKADVENYYNAGICASKAEKPEEAARYFRICAENNYKPEETIKNTATLLITAGKNEEAAKFLDESIAKDPKNPILYYIIGTLAMDKNDDEAVVKNFQKAIELKPDFADAHYNLGVYFSGKGDDLRTKLNEIDKVKEKAKYDEYSAKSLEYYRQALPSLEEFVKTDPSPEVLMKLMKMSRSLKDTEREAKYKAAYEAAKAKQ